MNTTKSEIAAEPMKAEQFKQLITETLGQYLETDEVKNVVDHCEILTFNEETFVFQQSKILEGFYFILKGQIHLIAQVLGSGSKKVQTLGAGNFIGTSFFIEQCPSSATAVVIKKTECLYISRVYFEYLAMYYPEIKYKLLKAVSKQICRRLKYIHDKTIIFISHAKMNTVSLLSRIIYSIAQPKRLNGSQVETAKTLLCNSTLFQNLNEQNREVLLKHSVFLEAPKNCTLLQENSKESCCFIVIQGAVQSSIMKDNKYAKLSVIGPGSLFAGIGCVDTESEFMSTFITCESSILLKISDKSLKFFQENTTDLWYKLFNLICESLILLGKCINKLDIRLHIETYNR